MKLVRMLPFLALAACGSEFSAPDSTRVPARVTYQNSVKDVLDNHCTLCHAAHYNRGADESGVQLDTYASASAWSDRLYEISNSGEMPPGPGSKLGKNDLEILRKWAATGAPEK